MYTQFRAKWKHLFFFKTAEHISPETYSTPSFADTVIWNCNFWEEMFGFGLIQISQFSFQAGCLYLPAGTATPRTPKESAGSHSRRSLFSFSTRLQLLGLAGSGKHPSLSGHGMLGVGSPLQGFGWHSSTCSSLARLGKVEEEERQHTFFSFLLHTESLKGPSKSK